MFVCCLFEIGIALGVKFLFLGMSYVVKIFSVIGEQLEVPILCHESTKTVKSMIFLLLSNQPKCFIFRSRYV